jgi:hypothetical protein
MARDDAYLYMPQRMQADKWIDDSPICLSAPYSMH